jgi:hypothetical protein
VHEKRKERSIRNIFSDPVIEKSLGHLAEDVLKEDRAREFREHIKKVGGRFSRFSYKRKAISPDIVAPIVSECTPIRPSFAPLQSHGNILGLKPESSSEELTDPEIIEAVSPVRIAARPADIKNMSLHSSNLAPDASNCQTSDVPAHASDYGDTDVCRPLSATARSPHINHAAGTEGLSLAGNSLRVRMLESSGRDVASRSAYVTAGTRPFSPSPLPSHRSLPS